MDIKCDLLDKVPKAGPIGIKTVLSGGCDNLVNILPSIPKLLKLAKKDLPPIVVNIINGLTPEQKSVIENIICKNVVTGCPKTIKNEVAPEEVIKYTNADINAVLKSFLDDPKSINFSCEEINTFTKSILDDIPTRQTILDNVPDIETYLVLLGLTKDTFKSLPTKDVITTICKSLNDLVVNLGAKRIDILTKILTNVGIDKYNRDILLPLGLHVLNCLCGKEPVLTPTKTREIHLLDTLKRKMYTVIWLVSLIVLTLLLKFLFRVPNMYVLSIFIFLLVFGVIFIFADPFCLSSICSGSDKWIDVPPDTKYKGDINKFSVKIGAVVTMSGHTGVLDAITCEGPAGFCPPRLGVIPKDKNSFFINVDEKPSINGYTVLGPIIKHLQDTVKINGRAVIKGMWLRRKGGNISVLLSLFLSPPVIGDTNIIVDIPVKKI